MLGKALTLFILVVAASGCLRDPAVERAFSKKWAHQMRSEKEHAARKARLKGEGIKLFGKQGAAKAAVKMDEEGKPRLNVGKGGKISADLDVRHGKPDVEVKYKLKWKQPRPKRKKD